ncbi:MAG: hypothetical protein HY403_05490 [Elusimicrobia bacterium]|nr:hypothetical protein [Elusimicrobiota bacterium]
MIIASFLAALLSASASAQASSCKINEMTAEWAKVTFGLSMSNYTFPDPSSRVDTLSYMGCSADGAGLETRDYVGRVYTVTAVTNSGGENGTTTLTLYGHGGRVPLGSWRHHKVFDVAGVGKDDVAVPGRNGRTNVFVIPDLRAISESTERTYGRESTERTYGEASGR